jgi:cytochrome c-type biogenesis protein CcmH/NrfG
VARGTQHRKRRPRTNARPAAAVAAPAKAQQQHRQKTPQWQEQLFFARLRNHAKWIYLFLAICFAATFALLGVGSGSSGISSALQNFFSSNSSSGPSISSLEHKTQDHPQDPTAWRNLATAYEQKHRTSDAITALERYTALRPKDQDALQELAAQYTNEAASVGAQAQSAQQVAQLADPQTGLTPSSTTPFGQLFNTTSGLQSPISSALSSTATSQANTLIQQYNQDASNAESTYKKLAKLAPKDASAQIQLGQAAQAAGDTATAIAAYRTFLKLVPKDDPDAASVRQLLKQLAPVKK